MFSERYEYYRLSDQEKEAVIGRIVEVLRNENIPLALVFGSFVELNSFRDIDLAVYLRDADLDYLFRLADRLEDVVGYPVNVVPLSEISPKFRYYILTKGLVIWEEYSGLYEALLMQTLDELWILEHRGL